jgi:hypothetical protein
MGARNNSFENIVREYVQRRAFDGGGGGERPKKEEREHTTRAMGEPL